MSNIQENMNALTEDLAKILGIKGWVCELNVTHIKAGTGQQAFVEPGKICVLHVFVETFADISSMLSNMTLSGEGDVLQAREMVESGSGIIAKLQYSLDAAPYRTLNSVKRAIKNSGVDDRLFINGSDFRDLVDPLEDLCDANEYSLVLDNAEENHAEWLRVLWLAAVNLSVSSEKKAPRKKKTASKGSASRTKK